MTLRTPPEIILELAYAYAASRALHVVAEAGVADALDDEARAVEELAEATGLVPDALERLLRLLEERSVFRRVDGDRWAHTDASRLLRQDHSHSLRGFARMTGTPFSWGSFTNLGHSARTGQSGSSRLHPEGWVAYLEAHPDEAEIFQDAMTAKAHGHVAAALAAHDFGRYQRICDVGGGNGHLLRAVRAAHPGVAGVNFDLPAVAGQLTTDHGIDVVAGDFFVDPLPTADAYVLMNIIHDWDDKAAIAVLEAVATAARGSDATVLLLEALMVEGPERHWAKTLDVVMLAITGGRERTLGEYAALLDAAGLRLKAMTPTTTPFSVIEASVVG